MLRNEMAALRSKLKPMCIFLAALRNKLASVRSHLASMCRKLAAVRGFYDTAVQFWWHRSFTLYDSNAQLDGVLYDASGQLGQSQKTGLLSMFCSHWWLHRFSRRGEVWGAKNKDNTTATRQPADRSQL